MNLFRAIFVAISFFFLLFVLVYNDKIPRYLVMELPKLTGEKLERLDFIGNEVIADGLMETAKHKAIILGISRDNNEDMQVMTSTIESLGGIFADYRVVIFENDSKDGTKESLKGWQDKNGKVKIISEDFRNKKRPNIQFLADARNRYLREIESSKYDDFDILVVIDMDMSYGVDIRGVLDSFTKFEKWGAVCSNGIYRKNGTMWDAFAFRNEELPHGLNDTASNEYWNMVVTKCQKTYDPEGDLIPVYSCFGGLAFYKKGFVKSCKYHSIKDDCEHVEFNKCIGRNGGKMFLNPAQVIRYSHYY